MTCSRPQQTTPVARLEPGTSRPKVRCATNCASPLHFCDCTYRCVLDLVGNFKDWFSRYAAHFYRHWYNYSPVGANEWADPHSSYLTNEFCWSGAHRLLGLVTSLLWMVTLAFGNREPPNNQRVRSSTPTWKCGGK